MKAYLKFIILTITCQSILAAEHVTTAFHALIQDATHAEVVLCKPEAFPASISRVRARFNKADLDELKTKVQLFSSTFTDPQTGSSFPAPSCRCLGDHYIIFWKNGAILHVFTYHHGQHLRSALLNNGSDAILTEASQAWLNAKIQLSELIELEQSKTKRSQK